MRTRRSILKSATAALALTLGGTISAKADDALSVVATFSILGDMVAEVGGEHVSVTTLVGPDGDAHVYQPTPADARAVNEADVLFVNGLEFEGWIDRLVEASGFNGTPVVATAGIDAIAFEEGDDHDDHHGEDHAEHDDDDHDHDDHAEHKDDDHAGHDHDDHAEHKDEDHAGHDHDDHAEHEDEDHAGHDHHGHNHGAFDPHAWQSLENGVIYATNIAEALAAADPDNAAAYQANAEAFTAEMKALDSEIVALMDALPAEARTVVTSHDAFGYFAAHYGLTFEAPQGLSTEAEASAADVAEMITQIREEGISAVFVETITDNRLLEQIANETGAVIGGTLYSDALSGADGPAGTYLDMMRHNAMTLARALGS
ncbi:MAG: zinc ABC transporter substrate-binding protein [Pseudomonadota bacterium]